MRTPGAQALFQRPATVRQLMTRPQADAEGYIIVGGGHGTAPTHHGVVPPSAPSPTPSTTSNRYNILMEDALATVKEHACALEEAAMERHRLRMERAKQEFGIAIEDAVEQINKASSKKCAEQKEQIPQFCDQHSADMIEMLDNFT